VDEVNDLNLASNMQRGGYIRCKSLALLTRMCFPFAKFWKALAESKENKVGSIERLIFHALAFYCLYSHLFLVKCVYLFLLAEGIHCSTSQMI